MNHQLAGALLEAERRARGRDVLRPEVDARASEGTGARVGRERHRDDDVRHVAQELGERRGRARLGAARSPEERLVEPAAGRAQVAEHLRARDGAARAAQAVLRHARRDGARVPGDDRATQLLPEPHELPRDLLATLLDRLRGRAGGGPSGRGGEGEEEREGGTRHARTVGRPPHLPQRWPQGIRQRRRRTSSGPFQSRWSTSGFLPIAAARAGLPDRRTTVQPECRRAISARPR